MRVGTFQESAEDTPRPTAMFPICDSLLVRYNAELPRSLVASTEGNMPDLTLTG